MSALPEKSRAIEGREVSGSLQGVSSGRAGSETSPSKRRFLKSVLLTGAGASLALALPAVYASGSPVADKPTKSTTTTTTSTQSTLKLSRIFRLIDPKTGAPQISDFQDSAPSGSTDLEVRMKHFTEIENFTFLGYVLSHELGDPTPRPIETIQGLTVPDAEFQSLVTAAENDLLGDEDLGDALLDNGINWEHFVASNNTLLIPGNPLKITDTAMQAKIDSLDLITEALVAEVNRRSEAEAKGRRRR